MIAAGLDLRIAHPPGYDLDPQFTAGATVYHEQAAALDGADFVYIKNWSSFADYGAMPPVHGDWMLQAEALVKYPDARFMHCLPVRRNVEVADAILDSPHALIYQQAANRTVAAQTVLKKILEG
jgi:N-succinyl-L-ornithine transcarbamylase